MFEKSVKIAAVDQQQQAKYNYYITKMNQPGMNVQNLVRALDSDMTFTDANMKLLARNAIMAKFTGTQTSSGYEGSNSNEQGLNKDPVQQQNQQPTTGVQPRPGSMQLAQDQEGLETQPGQPLPSQAETDLFTKIKTIYAEFEKQFNNYGIMPSLNTVQSDPKRMIASIRKQLQVVFANIQTMEKIYYMILQNPTDLGGIMQGLRRSSANKFVKLAKFEKVMDSEKEKLADEELENYINNEMDYAPYGTALEHPQENRNKLIDEIKVHSSNKFKKV
jgi:hypothetical protein